MTAKLACTFYFSTHLQGRLEKELAANRATQLQLADKLDQLHTDLYRGKEKMDQFKLVMNWNQEEFAQWALAAKQKEEDNMALEQYQRQDEVKIREVTLQLEKLSTESLKRRRDLAAEVTETQAAQIELNKTAQDFRQLHTERQDLVQQWDTAVAAMHRRYACMHIWLQNMSCACWPQGPVTAASASVHVVKASISCATFCIQTAYTASAVSRSRCCQPACNCGSSAKYAAMDGDSLAAFAGECDSSLTRQQLGRHCLTA